MHKLHEAGQLVSESDSYGWECTTHPNPSAPADRDYHLFVCPCQWVLLCLKLGKRREDFDVFSLLIDSSAVGACSTRETICSASLRFSSAAIEKLDIHNNKENFTFNKPLQFKYVDVFGEKNSVALHVMYK